MATFQSMGGYLARRARRPHEGAWDWCGAAGAVGGGASAATRAACRQMTSRCGCSSSCRAPRRRWRRREIGSQASPDV